MIISFFFRTGKIRPLLSSREKLRKVRYKYIVRVQVERTRVKLYLEFSLPFVIKCFAPEGAGIKSGRKICLVNNMLILHCVETTSHEGGRRKRGKEIVETD